VAARLVLQRFLVFCCKNDLTDPEAIRARALARLAEQRLLAQSLLRVREQVQGSLFERYGECGKPGCACREGHRHGPYHVLSTRGAGGSGFSYLEGERVAEARELVDRYREFRAGLRRLRKLNAEIVTLLKRYQGAMSRRGVRRLGLLKTA
jgi:hypothetical protein